MKGRRVLPVLTFVKKWRKMRSVQYRKDKRGDAISALGFGCMRFTQSLGRIKIDKAEREIMAAFRAGVNYFDTAYIYPGSESALGEIFERNKIRDKIKIATKLPHYLLKTGGDIERYFSEQKSRLRTDRVDFYLMHMLTDAKTWGRLKALGIENWLAQKKASGEIGQVGFSYHGNSDNFCELLDVYDWDFCQIQYNYMDENSQAGRTGLQAAAEKKIPVVIMEPLRGGKLAKGFSREVQALFDGNAKGYSPAEWSFRWLYNQSGIMCVLSGMNAVEMVEENAKIADSAKIGDFSKEDEEFLRKIAEKINKNLKVPCTGCRYCMPCPQKVDIPGTFAAYNHCFSENWLSGMREYVMATVLRRNSTAASNCVSCGKCESHCPQGIKIREELKNARKTLETPIYKIARKIIRAIMKY